MLPSILSVIQAWDKAENIQLSQIYLTSGHYYADWYEGNRYTGGSESHRKVANMIADVAEIANKHNIVILHLVRTHRGLNVWFWSIRDHEQLYEHCNSPRCSAEKVRA